MTTADCRLGRIHALPPNATGLRLCLKDQPQRVQLQWQCRNQFPAPVERSDVAAPRGGRSPGHCADAPFDAPPLGFGLLELGCDLSFDLK